MCLHLKKGRDVTKASKLKTIKQSLRSELTQGQKARACKVRVKPIDKMPHIFYNSNNVIILDCHATKTR